MKQQTSLFLPLLSQSPKIYPELFNNSVVFSIENVIILFYLKFYNGFHNINNHIPLHFKHTFHYSYRVTNTR